MPGIICQTPKWSEAAHLLPTKEHQEVSSLVRTLAWKSLRTLLQFGPAPCVGREREGWRKGGREVGWDRGREHDNIGLLKGRSMTNLGTSHLCKQTLHVHSECL